jgi:hypothetical protein
MLGSFDGTFSGQDSFCSPPTVVESFAGTISLSVTDQQGAAFTATGTIIDDEGLEPIAINGSIAADGSVTGSLNVLDPADPASATLTGSLSGDTLLATFVGSDTDCTFSGSMTLSRGGAITPANAPSNVVTTKSEINSFVRGQPVANSNRIRSVLRGGGNRGAQASNSSLTLSGMSAGEGSSAPVGAWLSYSYADTENDFASTAFSSARHSGLFGLDIMPADNWLLGVSVGLERSSVKTGFNNGEQDITAFTVAPYMGLVFNDWLTLDASIGISDVKNEQFRLQATTRVNSKVRSTRWFANINLAASYSFDALRLTGLGGLLWASQRDDDFLESNGQRTADGRFKIGRSLVGGEIAYSAGAWEPYAGGLFTYDFTSTSQQFAAGVLAPDSDNTDMLLSFGLRYFGTNNITGSLEYSTLLGRKNLTEDSINTSIRWQF